MDSPIPKITITFQSSQNIPIKPTTSLRFYIREQEKTCLSPFSIPVHFDLEPPLTPEPILLILEDSTSEIGQGDFISKEGEHQIPLYSKDSIEIGKIKLFVTTFPDESQLKKTFTERSLSSDHDCPRCSYMERVHESTNNQHLALEEYQSFYGSLKDLIVFYYSPDHIRFASKYIPEVEELGVDLPSSYHGKPTTISLKEAENLKSSIINLTEKLRVFQPLQEDIKGLKQQLFESHMNRLKIQKSIKEKDLGADSENGDQVSKRIDAIDEKAKASLMVIEQQGIYLQKLIQIDEIKTDISHESSHLQILKSELQSFNNMIEHISKLDSELALSKAKRDDLALEHDKAAETFHTGITKHIENNAKLTLEKQHLLSELEQVKKELSDIRSSNDSVAKENSHLEAEISKLEEEVATLSEFNREIELSRQVASEKEDVCIKLHKNIFEASFKFENQLKTLSETTSELLKDKLTVVDDLNKLEHFLELKTAEVQDLTRSKYNSLAQCTILEQQVHIQNDQLEIQKSIDGKQELNDRIKNILQEEILNMGNRLKVQSEECSNLSRAVEGYKKTLDEKINAKKEVKKIVAQLRLMKKAYIPVRGEQVDELLAGHLRTRDDWTAIDIKRVSKGVYLFGSKEVSLYIDQNCLMVAFGKARMDIEEFLEVYLPLEQQKMKLKSKVSH